jgi:hypothetical protein
MADRILKDKEKKVQELSLEIQHFHSDKNRGSRQNVWFFIVAVANNWSENIEIFGEEF